jgi:hypothetical protein
VIGDDPEYEALRRKLHDNIDGIASHPNYSRDLERSLRQAAEEVVQLEEQLATGVAELLNNHRVFEAIYWYAKMVRGQLIFRLWSHQLHNDPSNIDYGRRWSCASLSSDRSAAEFFETERVETVDIWRRSRTDGKYFHLWIGAEEARTLRDEQGRYDGVRAYYDACRGVDEDKYVFPQMVQKYLTSPARTGPPIWELEEAVIGIS